MRTRDNCLLSACHQYGCFLILLLSVPLPLNPSAVEALRGCTRLRGAEATRRWADVLADTGMRALFERRWGADFHRTLARPALEVLLATRWALSAEVPRSGTRDSTLHVLAVSRHTQLHRHH